MHQCKFGQLWVARIGIVLGLMAGVHGGAAGQDAPEGAATISPPRKVALDAISARSLQGHIAFLASDLLEGRDTPSRGLDLAAEYIASQFRRAGLEPTGDDGYFQTASWKVLEPDPATFRLEVSVGGKTFALAPDRVSMSAMGSIDVEGRPLLRLKGGDAEAFKGLTAEQVGGKVVVLEPHPKPGEAPLAFNRAFLGLLARIRDLKASGALILDRGGQAGAGLGRGRLIDPESRGARLPRDEDGPGFASATIHDPLLIAAIDGAGSLEGASATIKLGKPVERPVKVRNVAGLLRGSDPRLREEYVLVSAHYDHIGIGSVPGTADRIYNGANDDASGTAMVMELASALAKMEPRPKRSLLFLAWFGEEKGLLGSRYYGEHPLVPLKQTAAMINLEQVGRTDDSEGDTKGRASVTGFDFSEVGAVLAKAGKAAGIDVVKHPRNSDAFFGRSDNQALADRGIPAHTLCTAFLFPDYHQVGDHWDKIDYENMGKIARAVSLGLIELADAPEAPRWDESNPKAARYLKAWKALRGGN